MRLAVTYSLAAQLALMIAAGVPVAHASEDDASVPRSTADLDIVNEPSMDGVTIGGVEMDIQNVFDPRIKSEDKWFYHLANRLHFLTRPEVIESQLLFESGEPYSKQKIEETERLLRKQRYLGEAEISVGEPIDGVVDVVVSTKDVWTTKPELSFGRKGGVNTGSFGFEDHNLFGFGSHLGIEARRTVDRDILSLGFGDNNFRGSRYAVSALFSDKSDGTGAGLSVQKPFFSLDSRRSHGLNVAVDDRIETIYELGLPSGNFSVSSRDLSAHMGWSQGLVNGWARRFSVGFAADEDLFSPVIDDSLPNSVTPEDRRFIYPFLGFELVEDAFETTRNLDQIDRIEDRLLGTRLYGQIGYSPGNEVTEDGAALFSARIYKGWRLGSSSTLLTEALLDGRYESGGVANTLLSGTATLHLRQSDKRVMYARVEVTDGTNMDLDSPVILGGTTGLRGYPLRYQTGTGRALLTIEQRFFTDWYPFRLFRVGAAAFVDMGILPELRSERRTSQERWRRAAACQHPFKCRPNPAYRHCCATGWRQRHQ